MENENQLQAQPGSIDIDAHLEQLSRSESDINQHLYTIKEYAKRCESITELGTRSAVSTVALVAARPKTLRCHDLLRHENVNVIEAAAKSLGIDFQFFEENDLYSKNIVESDMIFIDTMHTYKQLAMELFLFGHKAKKYLVFHDVFYFGRRDQPCFAAHEFQLDGNLEFPNQALNEFYRGLGDDQGLMPAIERFLTSNPEWKIIDLNVFNNGLMVLGRQGLTDLSHGFLEMFMDING